MNLSVTPYWIMDTFNGSSAKIRIWINVKLDFFYLDMDIGKIGMCTTYHGDFAFGLVSIEVINKQRK